MVAVDPRHAGGCTRQFIASSSSAMTRPPSTSHRVRAGRRVIAEHPTRARVMIQHRWFATRTSASSVNAVRSSYVARPHARAGVASARVRLCDRVGLVVERSSHTTGAKHCRKHGRSTLPASTVGRKKWPRAAPRTAHGAEPPAKIWAPLASTKRRAAASRRRRDQRPNVRLRREGVADSQRSSALFASRAANSS